MHRRSQARASPSMAAQRRARITRTKGIAAAPRPPTPAETPGEGGHCGALSGTREKVKLIPRGVRLVGLPLLAAWALLVPCGTHAQPGGPLDTAVKFFEARQVSHCGKVWPLYSAATQEHVRADAHRRE